MDVEKRIAGLQDLMADARQELQLLAGDRVVTRGDLKRLVAKVAQIDRDIDEALAHSQGATALELEELLDVRRAAIAVSADVDRYLKATL